MTKCAMVVGLGLALVCGCEHVPPAAPAAPSTVALPDSIRSLHIFVDEAQGLGNHAELARALESQLQSSGVATTTAGTPRDVDAILHADATGMQLRFLKPDGSQVAQLSSSAPDTIAWAKCMMGQLTRPSFKFLIPVSEVRSGTQIAQGFGLSALTEQPDCPSLTANIIAELVGQMARSQALAQMNTASPPPASPPSPASTPTTVAATAPAAPTTPAVPPAALGSMVRASPQPTAYAIVIGIEKYTASLPPPTGARTDAQRFSDLARASLGVPPDHIQTLFDEQATKGSIERALASAQVSVPAGGRIYFYFSGHGAPDATAGTPYIVPTDGDPQFLDATAIQMKEVLSKLGQSKAREVLAIVDSCFSGAGGRSVLPPGARPLVRVKEEAAPAQLALFSASSGSEISGPTPEGNGGLFTKYVVDGLGTGAADMNGDGQVSLGELSQWVQPRVSRDAKMANRNQNPALTVGRSLGSADSFIVEWGLATK